MDLLVALFERSAIHIGSKRKSGEITEDSEAASIAQSEPSCEYAVGLWLSTPTTHRTDTGDFSILMNEAFLSNVPTRDGSDRAIESKTADMPPVPALPGQWDDFRCASCGEDNWYWRHYCRSCGKDSTGWRHYADCVCAACVAERGRAQSTRAPLSKAFSALCHQ